MSEATKSTRRTFPAGCKIINIRPGAARVYATLVGPDGDLLIAIIQDKTDS